MSSVYFTLLIAPHQLAKSNKQPPNMSVPKQKMTNGATKYFLKKEIYLLHTFTVHHPHRKLRTED